MQATPQTQPIPLVFSTSQVPLTHRFQGALQLALFGQDIPQMQANQPVHGMT